MFSRLVFTKINYNLIQLKSRSNHHLAKNVTITLRRPALLASSKRMFCKEVNDETKSNKDNKTNKKSEDPKSDDKDLIESRDEELRFEDESDKMISIYDEIETVEEVRLRLIKESEILTVPNRAKFMYPAGFDYSKKFEQLLNLEKKDIEVYRDYGACSLINSTVLVIGGGLLGTSIAYWLRELGTDMFDVNVIDRDFKQLYSNTGLTAAGLQQQFTTRECLLMSNYSAEFLRTVRRNLNVFSKEPPDIDFCPTGNLILAEKKNVDQMLETLAIQHELGQKTILLNKENLKEQFSWLNLEDIEFASYGLENEGHFDSRALLRALKIKAENLQARFWECEFVDFNLHLIDVLNSANTPLKLERARKCLVRDKNNELFQIEFDHVVIAAGPENYKFGKLLGLGDVTHLEPTMHLPIPLKKRKRYYYAFECNEGPGINFPLLIDPSGVFCRPENYTGRFIAGKLPSENEEIDNNNSDVDYKYFENIIQPVLVKRIPAFKNLKLLRGWSCFEDVNTIDGLPLIGEHPFFDNVTFVGGLGVHAASFAPAVGLAVAEKLLFDEYQTLDLTRLGWQRFFTDFKFENKENLKF